MSETPDRRGGLNRRTFLRGAGAGLGMTVLGAAGAEGRVLAGVTEALTRTVGATDVLRAARVWPSDVEEAAAILASFDDTHRVFDDGSFELLLWPGDLTRLQASGVRYDILVEDVIARDERALRAADTRSMATAGLPGQQESGEYRTLEEFEADLMALVAAHEDRARLLVLPNRTLEGRQVLGIEIADDVHAVDTRPTWYMDGLHHAREWPSGEATIMFAHELLENPEGDERIDAIRAGTRSLLVPVVNPDGFSWSRGALVQTADPNLSLPFAVIGQEAYWRKNRRGLIDQAVVPGIDRNPTSFGVDVNRNYSARWGGPGAGSLPAEQTYRGAGPLSEPEPANVAALLRERQPIGVHSNHTYTGLVLRPWGHSGGEGRFSPDEPLMRDLGAHMAKDSGYRNIHSFDLYVTTGTTTDWAYAALGSLSFCLELGFSNFHPAYAGPDGALNSYAKNREAFLILAETALEQQMTLDEWTIGNGEVTRDFTGEKVTYGTHARIEGTVVDGDGNPLPADLRVSRTTRIPLGAAADAEFFDEPSQAIGATPGGAFSWSLPPSTTPTAIERGEEEAWLLEIVASGETFTHEVVVDRGQTVNIGEIRVGDPTGGGGGGGGGGEPGGGGNGRGKPEGRGGGKPAETGRPAGRGRERAPDVTTEPTPSGGGEDTRPPGRLGRLLS